MNKTSFGFALMTKEPSAFVAVAMFDPLMLTVAPERGQPVGVVTTPDIFCCAKLEAIKNKKVIKKKVSFFINKFSSNRPTISRYRKCSRVFAEEKSNLVRVGL